MPSYNEAKEAVATLLTTNWSTTPIVLPNKSLPIGWTSTWPPVNSDAILQPWTQLEILGNGSEIQGTGTKGNHLWHYWFDILVHVFVPVGEGQDRANEYAVQIGEIFRAAEFYNDTPGFGVRTLAPAVDDGSKGDDDGNWWRVTMSVPATYWHRG